MKAFAALYLLSAFIGIGASSVEQAQDSRPRPWFGGPVSKQHAGELGSNAVQSPWGGSVQYGRGWRTVTGTTVIPRVTGQSPSAGAAAWVGIDGYGCKSAILQTGVTTWGDGSVDAWFEWWPLKPMYYTRGEMAVKAGDTVRMSVNATSARSGTSTIENLTTGQSVTTPYENMRYPLCMSDAEWVIEYGGGASQFANFGVWDITHTAASGSSGQVSANGGYITNVVINGRTYTDCGANANGVRCRWI